MSTILADVWSVGNIAVLFTGLALGVIWDISVIVIDPELLLDILSGL